jgi:ribosomal protein L12E/L44/L45/RPP1/RPP2
MDNRDNISDEVPVADAVEQGQDTASVPAAPGAEGPPAGANASDWQEQRREIVGADDEREEYPE